MSNARDKANIPALNFSSTGIDDNATSTAITIANNGDVGINNTIPNSFQFSARALVVGSGSGNQGMTIYSDATGAQSYGGIHFADGTTGDEAFRGILYYQHSTDSMSFWTTALERMRIDSSGNVGIGTSSPGAELDVFGGILSPGEIRITNAGGNPIDEDPIGKYSFYTTDASGIGAREIASIRGINGQSGTTFAGELGFYTSTFNSNVAEAMRIDKNGNVGIGGAPTNASDHKSLALFGASGTGAGFIEFTDTSGNADGAVFADDGNLFINADYDNTTASSSIRFRVDGSSEKMRIDSSGNVGIGTSSTTGDGLTIYGSTNNTILTLQNPNVTSGFRFSMGESGYSHQVLRLYDNSNRAVVNFDGEMGLTSFGSVQGEVGAGEQGVSIRGAVGQIRVGINSTGLNTVMGFFNPNGEVGTIRTTGSSTQYNTSSDYRLKENVSYDFDATTRLKQLRPARFNFIADADTTVDGFLAHEVQDVVPEAISGEKDETKTKEKVVVNANGQVIAENIEQADWETGKIADEDGNTQYPTDSTWEATKVVPVYQGIDQSKLVPLLVKTIQELEARITALETQP